MQSYLQDMLSAGHHRDAVVLIGRAVALWEEAGILNNTLHGGKQAAIVFILG